LIVHTVRELVQGHQLHHKYFNTIYNHLGAAFHTNTITEELLERSISLLEVFYQRLLTKPASMQNHFWF